MTSTQRAGGRLGLSPICFGTMRLDRTGRAAEAAALLREAHEGGVTSFHTSSEYETFPLFREAWTQARRDGLTGARVIAKVASPHFNEPAFSAETFRAKVEAYLQGLGLERLDVVQWLLRFYLKQEPARLAILNDSAAEIGEVTDALKREGKIGHLVSFPYTASLAREVVEHSWCEGLALYINPLEREMDPEAERCAALGKSVVAIRPYAAGRLFTETSLGAEEALEHVFGTPGVETAVVSVSSREHLQPLLRWAGR